MTVRGLVRLLVFALAGLVWLAPGADGVFGYFFEYHRYFLGIMAFAVLGPLGEDLVGGLRRPGGEAPLGWPLRALIWGGQGLAWGLWFWLVNGGVVMAQAVGFLPGGGYAVTMNPVKAFVAGFFFTGPFFTSLFLNLGPIQAVAFLRRLAEEAMRFLTKGRWPSPAAVFDEVDWAGFIRREALILPFIRLPFLTMVFMFAPELWLYLAAWQEAVLRGLTLDRSNCGR